MPPKPMSDSDMRHDDSPEQGASPVDPATLIRDAHDLLRRNDTGRFVKPSLGQYPHQWNWDAAFIAIGLRHLERARARDEVRHLLKGQWADGMLPHILYPDGPSDYFPDPAFWRTDGRSGTPFATSGLTQPPVLTTAVRMLVDDDPDQDAARAFAAETFPALLRWHRWLHAARDPHGTGLLAIVHPWESGNDNAPRFRAALDALEGVAPPAYRRRDQAHVQRDERPVAGEYDRFMHLIGLYRGWDWDPGALYERAPFLVQDVAFNALAHRAERDLRALAVALGHPTGEIDAWLDAGHSAFEERLWDAPGGLYLGRDLRSGAWLRENDVTTFLPLFAGVAAPGRAQRLVETHLRDPSAYARGTKIRFGLPSVAASSPRFEPRRYWCGPVWANMNWLVLQGLRSYGFDADADAVRRDTIALAARSGFVEYFDARDGSACGSRGFSWSAALVVDLLAEASEGAPAPGPPPPDPGSR